MVDTIITNHASYEVIVLWAFNMNNIDGRGSSNTDLKAVFAVSNVIH